MHTQDNSTEQMHVAVESPDHLHILTRSINETVLLHGVYFEKLLSYLKWNLLSHRI
jgi:hypothetical protein